MVPEEPRSVKQRLEVSQGDLAHGLVDARHEGGDGAWGEVDNLGGNIMTPC